MRRKKKGGGGGGGGGGEGITILGINVTILSLEISVNQSLFTFPQKGSYITNTLVYPNMSVSIST